MTKLKIFLGLILIAGLLSTSGYYFFTSQHFSYYLCRTLFYHYLNRDAREIEKESLSGETNVYYFTSYYLHGMLSAVEATGSEKLLKQTLGYLDNMVATAQPITYQGQLYEAWGPFVLTPDSGVPKPNVHYSLQATIPIARAAAIIMKNPRFKAKYKERAERYIKFADSSIIRYWYLARYKGHVPWTDVEGVPIWTDNSTNMGMVGLFLYDATGDPLYLRVVQEVGQAFKAKLAPWGQGWIWESQTIPVGSDTDNTPGSVGNMAGVPDTSHTNREAMIMVFMHEAGILFTRPDIDRMAHTFIEHIWNGSYEYPSFANYIDGNDKAYRVYKLPGLNGPIYHGWVYVGGYSKEAQDVLVATLKAIFLGKMNPGLERNSTSYGGCVGLAGHILRNYYIAFHNS